MRAAGPGRAARAGRGVRLARRAGRRGPAATRGCGSCPSPTWPRPGIVVDPAVADRLGRGCRATRSSTPTSVTVRRRVLPEAAGVVRRRPRDRRADRAAAQGGARLRPRGVRRRAADVPLGRRHAVPATILRARRHPARRHGAVRDVRLRRLRVGLPDQEWDPAIPSLLDRGVVYVHAHVRGGGEGGRRWWLDGPARAQAAHLRRPRRRRRRAAAAGLVDGARIATRGLSAGGLLQGAVFSQRPDRWRAVVAEVPFVDVVTTMLDPTHPADRQRVGRVGRPLAGPRTTPGWLAYSPYDNLPPAGRPPRPAGHRRRPRRRG